MCQIGREKKGSNVQQTRTRCASRAPDSGYDESLISQFFFAQCLWKLHICYICMFMFVFVQKRQHPV